VTKRRVLALMISVTIMILAACNRSGPPIVQADTTTATPAATSPPPITLEAGISIPVRLAETLDTRRNRSGDQFTATLDEPLVSGDRVIVPKGTRFAGHITEARPSGRFRGRGVMALTLDSFELNGSTYPLRGSNSTRWSGAHKKRNWVWIGGGSGTGATIGAAAGGGVGALIGAGAGAAAGTVGAVVTGRRQVELPIETRITFKLRSPLVLAS
jgi:hypothetical protein